MTRHGAEAVSAWFNGFFTTMIGISTLGASITFNYVVGKAADPLHTSPFSATHIQTFLAVSWLLFLLALGFASSFSTMLTFFRDHWKRDWEGANGRTSQREVQLYAAAATAVLGALVAAAFILLCLVVVGYAPAVGWVALGFTAAFGLLVAVAVLYQAPWPWQTNTPDPGDAKDDGGDTTTAESSGVQPTPVLPNEGFQFVHDEK